MDYKNFLKQILSQASTIALKDFGKVSATVKGKDCNQVVTQTDVEIGNFIISQINKTFPGHNIIDEEAGVIDNHSDFTWVIDPIDGTSNYAAGLPGYCIMIGLLKGKIPLAASVSLPAFSEIYLAELGQGAFCNDQKIQVTPESKLINALVAYPIDSNQANPQATKAEASLLGEIILRIRNFRVNGSCLDGLLVAKGVYGAWLSQTSGIWDNVAPQLIIEEAGGIYTDFFGKAIDYTDPLTKAKDNFTVCAANPALHRQLQEIIHRF
jgi:myo-inositol-1(or 4)-monophosphatase